MQPVDILSHQRADRDGRINSDALVQRLNEVITDMSTLGVRFWDRKSVFTGYAYNELYDWDMYFDNIFLTYLNSYCYGRNGVELFIDRQEYSGFISRTRGYTYPKPRHHFKPFLAQIALLSARQSKDFRWLNGRYYEGLKKYLEYWFRHCDADKNGLCFWDGSDHSGMDNQELRLGYDGVMEFEGVDLNCYLVRELWAMAEISRELNQPDVDHYTQKADSLSQLINTVLWDENDGFYYDRSEITGKLNKRKSVAGFIPLWLGIANKNQAEILIEKYLLNENEFWTPYPVATWSQSEMGFYPDRKADECSWMGATWIPTNYMIFHGLINYGYRDDASKLADKTYEMVISEHATREYYNSLTGSGLGLNPFWGWSTLAYVMPLEFDLDYDPTDISRKEFLTLSRFEFK